MIIRTILSSELEAFCKNDLRGNIPMRPSLLIVFCPQGHFLISLQDCLRLVQSLFVLQTTLPLKLSTEEFVDLGSTEEAVHGDSNLILLVPS